MKNKVVNDLIKKLKKKEKIKTNSDSISWLEKYTDKYPRFTDDEFLFEKKVKNVNDKENVEDLGLLFEVINEYANNNYLYAIKDSGYAGHYNIKYHNIGYEIGCMVGQGTLFFCGRTEYIDDNFIDFEDILLNKKQPHVDDIGKKLEGLQTIIATYYNQGVPIEAIETSLKEVIKDIHTEKEKSKVLRK